MVGRDGRLAGKVALITGAGSGAGYAMAQLFAHEGAHVAGVVRRDEHVEKLRQLSGVLPVSADVTRADDVDRMVNEAETAFGRLDIVCNVAGIHDLLSPLDATTDEMWDRIMDTDLKAPFRISRAAIRGMLEQKSGVILNIGSVASLRGIHGPSYNAAKAGLIGMTLSIAVAYGKQGIRCNIINSGGMETEITEKSGGTLHPRGFEIFTALTGHLPVNYIFEPADLARVAVFLCSDDARHINGAVLPVDGGLSAC
jgi:NAD(P)-dependent dehydrogenase (short-subunit alcohol dehydrogenase family)